MTRIHSCWVIHAWLQLHRLLTVGRVREVNQAGGREANRNDDPHHRSPLCFFGRLAGNVPSTRARPHKMVFNDHRRTSQSHWPLRPVQ